MRLSHFASPLKGNKTEMQWIPSSNITVTLGNHFMRFKWEQPLLVYILDGVEKTGSRSEQKSSSIVEVAGSGMDM